MDTRPNLKGKSSLYRVLGSIGSVSTLTLSSLWAILCLAGLIFYFVGGPMNTKKELSLLSPYTHSLVVAYYNKTLSSKTPTILSAGAVAVLTGIYFLLSLNLICASVFIVRVFYKWEKGSEIKKMTMYWTVSTLVMCVYELFVACVFIADFAHCFNTVDAEYIEAAALMMMTLSLKGYFMWGFNLAISSYLFYLHFIVKQCPV